MIGCHHEKPREVMQTQDFKTIFPFLRFFASLLYLKRNFVYSVFYAQITLQKCNSFYKLNQKRFKILSILFGIYFHNCIECKGFTEINNEKWLKKNNTITKRCIKSCQKMDKLGSQLVNLSILDWLFAEELRFDDFFIKESQKGSSKET